MTTFSTLTFSIDTGDKQGDVTIRLRPDLAPNHRAHARPMAQPVSAPARPNRAAREADDRRSGCRRRIR